MLGFKFDLYPIQDSEPQLRLAKTQKYGRKRIRKQLHWLALAVLDWAHIGSVIIPRLRRPR
jgi:hypothetical protein